MTALAAVLWLSPAGLPVQPPGALLVSLNGEGKVALVAPDTGRQIAVFPVHPGPHEITLARDGRFAFVANSGAGPGGAPSRTVSVLDLGARSTVRHLDVGHDRPHDVRVSRDGGTLWAACAPSRAVIEINVATGATSRTWSTGVDGGWFVAATPDDRKLYVPHLEGKTVTRIDRRTGAVATIVDGGAQSGIDVSPDGAEVWVVDHELRRINVIETATDIVKARISLESDQFGRLQFTPDGRRVLLVQERRLSLIDAAARTMSAAIDMPLAGKVLAISPDGRQAATSNPDNGQVTIVNLSPLAVVRSFPVGQTPDGVAWIAARPGAGLP